jgi:hypothetical protein
MSTQKDLASVLSEIFIILTLSHPKRAIICDIHTQDGSAMISTLRIMFLAKLQPSATIPTRTNRGVLFMVRSSASERFCRRSDLAHSAASVLLLSFSRSRSRVYIAGHLDVIV